MNDSMYHRDLPPPVGSGMRESFAACEVVKLKGLIRQLAINADTYEGRPDEGEQLRKAIRKAAEEAGL